MFSRTVSSPNRPSALRSSGQNAIPRRSDRPGERLVTGTPPTLRRPESDRTAPKISLATSVRPDPSNPASPTTSPARMERSNGSIRRRRPTPSATRIGCPLAAGAVAAARSSVRSSSRPSMSEISFSGGRSAVAADPTRRPLRKTEMRSAIWYTWSMKCVMKTIAIPRRLKSRMMRKSSSVSFASRLAVGSSSTRTRVSSSSARAIATSCWMATE